MGQGRQPGGLGCVQLMRRNSCGGAETFSTSHSIDATTFEWGEKGRVADHTCASAKPSTPWTVRLSAASPSISMKEKGCAQGPDPNGSVHAGGPK